MIYSYMQEISCHFRVFSQDFSDFFQVDPMVPATFFSCFFACFSSCLALFSSCGWNIVKPRPILMVSTCKKNVNHWGIHIVREKGRTPLDTHKILLDHLRHRHLQNSVPLLWLRRSIWRWVTPSTGPRCAVAQRDCLEMFHLVELKIRWWIPIPSGRSGP